MNKRTKINKTFKRRKKKRLSESPGPRSFGPRLRLAAAPGPLALRGVLIVTIRRIIIIIVIIVVVVVVGVVVEVVVVVVVR